MYVIKTHPQLFVIVLQQYQIFKSKYQLEEHTLCYVQNDFFKVKIDSIKTHYLKNS